MEQAIDIKEKKLAAQNFASFKFNMIDAMMVDGRLTPSDFRVGILLLQCLNNDTGEIYPSIGYIAEISGISPRMVRYCLDNLRNTGWIDWHRGNRQKANNYAFDTLNLAAMKARRKAIEQARRERRKRHPEGQPIATRTIQDPIPSGNPLPVASGNPLPPNTYKEHLYKGAAK